MDYILFDGSDIQKKFAKMMDGLDYVKDGDEGTIGLGYWLMNVVHFGKDREISKFNIFIFKKKLQFVISNRNSYNDQ